MCSEATSSLYRDVDPLVGQLEGTHWTISLKPEEYQLEDRATQIWELSGALWKLWLNCQASTKKGHQQSPDFLPEECQLEDRATQIWELSGACK